MRFLKLSAVAVLLLAVAIAQNKPAPRDPAQKPVPTHPAPLPEPKPAPGAKPVPEAIPGFDINALDRTADPCVDFFQFACGTWNAKNPVPPDRSRWGRFDALAERNLDVLREILEKAAPNSDNRDERQKKIGDYYASCMDEKAIDALGLKPLQPELERIAKIKGRTELIDTLAHLDDIGASSVFSFYSTPDLHHATTMIATVDQGGISLPDRDYYIKEDARNAETRAKYVEHVQKIFELMGDAPQAAARQARSVMAVETALAKASMDRTTRRDPKNRDHKLKVAELTRLAPQFEFTRFFERAKVPRFDSLNVANPEFFKQIGPQLESVPLDDWKTYLRWRLVRALNSTLPSAFVNQNFRFFGAYLGGAQELEARWKRCAKAVDRDLGELLGQFYVERAFGGDAKPHTQQMVRAIEQAMEHDLQTLPWMTETTKKQALDKLHAVSNNIGYPEKWRDYSNLKVVRGDAIGNFIRASAFENRRQLRKIGKPVDRKEWGMSPPTVNAYYRPSMNSINFPAGILQPPFFDPAMDDAVNFGGIGGVVAHELTHGFDDQGSKFDKDGNLKNWWSEPDETEFRKRTGCFVDQYAQYVALADVRLNGKLTLGENTADNGGVRLAYMALQNQRKGKKTEKIDGFTPEQRFFLGWGQIWCQNVTEAQARLRALTDPHSPGRYRVNGVVSNMPEFQQAFGCKAGQPMVRENACRVW